MLGGKLDSEDVTNEMHGCSTDIKVTPSESFEFAPEYDT